VAGSLDDISERKLLHEEILQLESRLRQAERFEAMGTLASGIAHDLNNILGAILGFGERAPRTAEPAGAAVVDDGCSRGFGLYGLELDERRLLKDGAAVPLRPRTFDLLVALVDRAGHLVTKNDLFDRVWPNMAVEETALRVQLSALRKVLGADAIATVTGQGYRFALPVTQREAEAQRLLTSRHNLPHQPDTAHFHTLERPASSTATRRSKDSMKARNDDGRWDARRVVAARIQIGAC
jgi:DNA-binding winged helix-turn-helix (wHTH) protein